PPPKPAIPVLPGPHLLKDHPRAVYRTLRISTLFLALAALGGLAQLFLRSRRSASRHDRALAILFLAAIAYFPIVSAVNMATGRYPWPSDDLSRPPAAAL